MPSTCFQYILVYRINTLQEINPEKERINNRKTSLYSGCMGICGLLICEMSALPGDRKVCQYLCQKTGPAPAK